MAGIPTVSVAQPLSALVAEGVVTALARAKPAPARLVGERLLIHAASTGGLVPLETDRVRYEPFGGPPILLEVDGLRLDVPFGAIVASATLAACAPIERIEWCDEPSFDRDAEWVLAEQPHADVSIARRQLPYQDWSPGRFAWLLDDVQPTTARCPRCWGTGKCYREDPFYGWHRDLYCDVCGGTGHCLPIPARGRPGVWRWQP